MAGIKKSRLRLLASMLFAVGCFGQETPAKPAAAPPPRHNFYRLDFVVKELENDKVINSRDYATTVAVNSSDWASIRAGSRIPYVTGGGSAPKQFQFYDIGVSIDSRNARELPSEQLSIHINAEISSVVVTKDSSPDGMPPMVRNTKWSSPVVLPLKKRTTVFSSDDPSGNRKMQLDLTATPIT